MCRYRSHRSNKERLLVQGKSGYSSCSKPLEVNQSQIKWQNEAHCHATWNPYGDVANYRGARKLENYFKKVVLPDFSMRNHKDIPPEEKEQWLLDREAVTDAQEEHTKIERVIAHEKDDEGNLTYLIKCEAASSALIPTQSLTFRRARSRLRELYMGKCRAGDPEGPTAD